MRNQIALILTLILFCVSQVDAFAQNRQAERLDSLKTEAMACFERNEIVRALSLQKEALEIIVYQGKKCSPEYAEALRDYSLFTFENGQILEAIDYIEEATAVFDSLYSVHNLESALSRLDLASYHSAISHYDKALEVGKNALATLEGLDSVPQDNYAVAVAKVSRFYEDAGDHEQSLVLAIKALTLVETVFGHKSDRYAQMLDQLSYIYYERGDLQNAIENCKEACEIFSEIPDSPFYVNAINDLAAYYCDSGDVQQSITLGQLACSLAKEVYGENTIFYINTVNNLARYYAAVNDLDNAIEKSETALTICNKLGLTSNISYARSLGHLANFYSQKGDFLTAINYSEESKPIFKTIFGDNTPGYVNCLRDLSRYYYHSGDYLNAIEYVESTNQMIQDIVLRAFSYMPSHERFLYWNWYKDWFYYEIPNFCLRIRTAQIAKIAYNSVLFSKGILLNTDVEERRIIQENDGETSIFLYGELQNARKELDMLPAGNPEAIIKRDSLTQVIVDLSDQLSKKSHLFNSFISKQSVNWVDVRNSLKKGEVAIEFVKVDMEDDCSYIALILKKNYERPHIIDLFSESQLRLIKEQSYYRTNQLYNLVWQPLEKELKKVKNVYFSPDGCMHSIGIENLLMPSGKLISEKYSLYRLSSTRELVFRQDRPFDKQAALFGGLDYNYNPQQPFIEGTEDNNQDELSVDLYRSISKQGEFGPLPATAKEVNEISQLLIRKSILSFVYMNQLGTESAFKDLSGNDMNIIHLATHGEYIPLSSHDNDDFLNKIIYERSISYEDLALTRSFIVLTSGNLVARPDYVKGSQPEDGILTSQEVSQLDFSKVNLVVLSACKTANGDITEDGVMGLQRGFKKAGANSIIMSLWEVEDAPTQYLMTRFYYYYIDGQPTNIAFNKAKNDLRNKYGTSGTRPYWASFIILDALN